MVDTEKALHEEPAVDTDAETVECDCECDDCDCESAVEPTDDTEEQGLTIQRLSDEELKDLAKRIVMGQVFITNNPEIIEMSFLCVLAFMSEEHAKLLEEAGAIYEEISKAGPRTINGYPIFFSMHLLHKDDLPILLKWIDHWKEVLELNDKPAEGESGDGADHS